MLEFGLLRNVEHETHAAAVEEAQLRAGVEQVPHAEHVAIEVDGARQIADGDGDLADAVQGDHGSTPLADSSLAMLINFCTMSKDARTSGRRSARRAAAFGGDSPAAPAASHRRSDGSVGAARFGALRAGVRRSDLARATGESRAGEAADDGAPGRRARRGRPRAARSRPERPARSPHLRDRRRAASSCWKGAPGASASSSRCWKAPPPQSGRPWPRP